MNYIELNNQVIIRDENGKFQLEKDKEALKSYLEDYIEPRMRYLIVKEIKMYCKEIIMR